MILLDQAGAGRDDAVLIAPPNNLASFVEHAFVQRHTDRERCLWRVVPDARANLVVSISRSAPHLRCVVVGPRSRFGDVELRDRRITCGVRLQIGALPTITGLPASEFADRVVSVGCLTGAAVRLLEQRLASAGHIPAILAALYAFVVDASRGRPPASDPRVFSGIARVSDLARRMARAPRAVYNRTVAQVGLSPKSTLRVERLHRALHARASGASWSAAAFAAGFADQPHLTRESRVLLGETPAQWQRRARCRFVQDRGRAAR